MKRFKTYPTQSENSKMYYIPSLSNDYLHMFSQDFVKSINECYGFIYKITNIVNNKIYIGKTTQNYNLRFQQHIKESKKKGVKSYLHKAIRKYSKENFELEIIKTCYSKEQLDLSESFFIRKYRSYIPDIGYNMVIHDRDHLIKDDPKINIFKDPNKNPMKGKSLHVIWIEKYGKEIADKKLEEFKEKQRIIGINKHKSGILKLSNKGHKMSDENKIKLSNSRKGENNPMYGKSPYDIWINKYGYDKAMEMKIEDIEKKKLGKINKYK